MFRELGEAFQMNLKMFCSSVDGLKHVWFVCVVFFNTVNYWAFGHLQYPPLRSFFLKLSNSIIDSKITARDTKNSEKTRSTLHPVGFIFSLPGMNAYSTLKKGMLKNYRFTWIKWNHKTQVSSGRQSYCALHNRSSKLSRVISKNSSCSPRNNKNDQQL